ncbi:MAG: site-specific DNA-methyltransferase [Leptospiraceae bacterium]|nr:site-specific DNA-methyltransferase [Leptospiraceae bacterium]
MAKKFKGSLTLEWKNKNKSIILQEDGDNTRNTDVPLDTKLHWVNEDESLYYEVDAKEGKGKKPYWVDRNDIRVKEVRPLIHQKSYMAHPIESNKKNELIEDPSNEQIIYTLEESITTDASDVNNGILIKGDNLLVLKALVKHFENKSEEERPKCICIDPPYNTQSALLSQYYEDNMEHSEWLTLMRDRLTLLKNILRMDGTIWVVVDDNESHYLKLLCDEVFGRDNFINQIIVKTKESSGASGGGEDRRLKKNVEFILCYARENFIKFNDVYSEIELGNYLEQMDIDEKSFKYTTVFIELGERTFFKTIKDGSGNDIEVYKHEKYRTKSVKKIAEEEKISEIEVYYKYFDKIMTTENAQTSIRTRVQEATDSDDTFYSIDYYPVSGRNKGKKTTIYFIGNQKRLVSWFSNVAEKKRGRVFKREKVGTFWEGFNWNNVTREGGVKFPNGQKPELLLQRVLQLATNPGDTVLDCFGGSGTTFAVAHKMGRNWVGVEIGNHADTHIIPRMIKVLNGEDQSGISKAVNWKGGGSFSYYHLGQSIISINKKGEPDFNWKLGRAELEKSLLLTYDFVVVEDASIHERKDARTQRPNLLYTIGYKTKNAKRIAGVCSLSEEPTLSNEKGEVIEPGEFMSYMEFATLLKKIGDVDFVYLYTNRGVEVSTNEIPENLEIVKVPSSIFQELED